MTKQVIALGGPAHGRIFEHSGSDDHIRWPRTLEPAFIADDDGWPTANFAVDTYRIGAVNIADTDVLVWVAVLEHEWNHRNRFVQRYLVGLLLDKLSNAETRWRGSSKVEAHDLKRI